MHDREGKRRVRGSCFRPGEQQCPQTNEHPASIVRLIGTAQPLLGSACCPGPPYVVVRGPRRTPTPGWGVPDQPDAGQHRLNIAASSNLRQRDSSLSFSLLLPLLLCLCSGPSPLVRFLLLLLCYLSIALLPPVLLSLHIRLSLSLSLSRVFPVLLRSALPLCFQVRCHRGGREREYRATKGE